MAPATAFTMLLASLVSICTCTAPRVWRSMQYITMKLLPM